MSRLLTANILNPNSNKAVTISLSPQRPLKLLNIYSEENFDHNETLDWYNFDVDVKDFNGYYPVEPEWNFNVAGLFRMFLSQFSSENCLFNSNISMKFFDHDQDFIASVNNNLLNYKLTQISFYKTLKTEMFINSSISFYDCLGFLSLNLLNSQYFALKQEQETGVRIILVEHGTSFQHVILENSKTLTPVLKRKQQTRSINEAMVFLPPIFFKELTDKLFFNGDYATYSFSTFLLIVDDLPQYWKNWAWTLYIEKKARAFNKYLTGVIVPSELEQLINDTVRLIKTANTQIKNSAMKLYGKNLINEILLSQRKIIP